VSLSRRQLLGAGAGLVLVAVAGPFAAPAFAARAASLRTSALTPDLWLIEGAGGNVVAMKGPEGSLLIDGGLAANSKALLDAARRATGNRRVATLINTHWHPAQTGSNEAVGREGGLIVAHEVTKRYLARAVASVDYTGLYGPLPEKARPAKTTRSADSLEFGGRRVDYGYLPAAHTNGDLFVHLPEHDVLVAGGPVCSESWPLLDWRNGAWLGGLVRAHEKLLAVARAGTRIVPANGRVIGAEELKRQLEMFRAFHDRMVGFQNKGMDVGDILAERPLKVFEAQYGDPSAFIDGAFRSLNLAYSPD
jgi:cyclase